MIEWKLKNAYETRNLLYEVAYSTGAKRGPYKGKRHLGRACF